MRNFIILGLASILLFSCRNEEKPKVIYPEDGNAETTELKKDSTLIEIADIPIHIDSTQYLIHPIGEFKFYDERERSYFGSSNYDSGSFSISNFNGNEITGDFHTLKFQKIDSENLTTLTKKNIRIKSISFLRDIFENTNKQILVYRILDKDSNRDNKLDDDDIDTLYISNIDGTNFTKLTAEFHDLIDWKVFEIMNRIYYRSIEDTNKNGEFDNEDKIYYQYVDFNLDKLEVTEYQPI